MLFMARKRPNVNATEPTTSSRPKRKGKPLNVWLADDLRDALERLRKKHRRPLREEVSIALEEYASKHGEFPAPDQADD